MPKDARFRVDARLASLLGENYRSTEIALRELVDNAWDADATCVWVDLPPPMSLEPIIVRDDGTGMTEQEVRQEYLNIADDRYSRKGELTKFGKRPVKGRKGIGKFAGLMLADRMNLETTVRKRRTRVEILKPMIMAAQDLNTVNLPIVSEECVETERNGTVVTLSDLNSTFNFPNPEKLRQILVLEYGRTENFQIFVNGEQLKIEDIPGEIFTFEEEVPQVGHIRLHFTVNDGSKSLKQSGVAMRVQGKLVGKSSYFGLDEDEIIPLRMLRKVYGEVEADGLADVVTADWGSIIESSIGYLNLVPVVQQHLRDSIRSVFQKEIKQLEDKFKPEVDRRLENVPEHRREMARRMIHRVIAKLYGESHERVSTVVSVILDAMEKDEYYLVLQNLEEAKDKDIRTLAEALGTFGLRDMSVIGAQARSRMQVLDFLDRLANDPATVEKDMHSALENNLWVLGADYALIASNKTLTTVVEVFTKTKFTGENARNRPDLLLVSSLKGKHLLIELKKPSISITRDHERQAMQYRDELGRKFSSMDILILGKGRAASIDTQYSQPGLEVLSFHAVISTARAQLDWLLRELQHNG